MQQHPFIFSNQRKYRIRRHLAFWASWWLFSGIIYSAGINLHAPNILGIIGLNFLDSLAFMGMHMFFGYSLMYGVIPKLLLKERYVWSILAVILLCAATAALSVLITMFIVGPMNNFYLNNIKCYLPLNIPFVTGFMAGLRGGITIGGLAAAIKLMKYWYVEGQKNLELQKENIESQLQVLKAQLHPHFLFNTLNNIYSKTQKVAPAASDMLFGLSDILRYMLYDCNKPLTPLSLELKMMNEYIALEKIRYGNRLDLHVDLPPNTDGYLVAPLIILPFIENCFKHGTSNMLDQPWISLAITIDGRHMTMKLLNSKPREDRQQGSHGIGIENVKKRLELLYPGKHELTITAEEEVFIVILKLQLELAPATRPTVKRVPQLVNT